MKLSNSPGRKNERRISALRRMSRDNPAYAATAATIVSQDAARAVRTKKDRSATARFSREA